MKIKVKVANKIAKGEYGYIHTGGMYGIYEVEPYKITRVYHSPYFNNVKARYDYIAHFMGIDDMKCQIYRTPLLGKECAYYINAKMNPEFDPKSLTWTNDVVTLEPKS